MHKIEFNIKKLLYKYDRGEPVDRIQLLKICNNLLDLGIWYDGLEPAIGPVDLYDNDIEKMLTTVSEHYGVSCPDRVGLKDAAITICANEINKSNGDHKLIMAAVQELVDFIQYDLDYNADDTNIVGGAAGIESYIGPYYEYDDIDCYQISEREKAKGKQELIEGLIEAANKAPSWTP